jgi:kinetochore protein Nuf2
MSMATQRRHSFDANEKIAFSFPLMKINEIKDCLNALEIKVTEAQLNDIEENKTLYREILEFLAELCCGVTQEEMAQPAFNGLSAFNNIELHDESIPTLHAFRAVQKMMTVCGIPDFSIKDYVQPSAKRFRRQLSGIINYAKFREERFALLVDVSKEREQLIEKLNTKKIEEEQLRNYLAQIQAERISNKEEDAIRAVEEDISKSEREITTLNTQQADIREEIAGLKGLNNTLKDGITARSSQLEQAIAQKAKLNSQIVTSPARYKQHIIDVGQAVAMELKDAKNAEKKLRELAGWLSHVDEAQQQVNAGLQVMCDVKSEVEKQKAISIEVEQKKNETAQAREVLGTLQLNVQDSVRQAARNDEKLQHLKKSAQQRSTEYSKTMTELHAKCLQAENTKRQLRLQADKTENEVVMMQKEFAASQMVQEQELQDMKAAYFRLESVVITHLQKLQQAVMNANSNNLPPVPPVTTAPRVHAVSSNARTAVV